MGNNCNLPLWVNRNKTQNTGLVQQYFSYILAVCFMGGGKGVQTLSHNVASSTPCLERVQAHKLSGDTDRH